MFGNIVSAVFGLMHHKIEMGAMTGELFNEFLRNTSEQLDENHTHYLIFDGAPAHRGATSPADNTETFHHTLHF